MLQLSNRRAFSTAWRKSVSLLFGITFTFFVGCLSCHANSDSELADDLMIKELMARYMFAMDWRNADDFASTFIEDGVIELGQTQLNGHEALKDLIVQGALRDQELIDSTGKHKPVLRTSVHNIVTEIEGDHARAWSYWTAIDNRNKDRKPRLNSFGHYRDELVKVDGRWYFAKRTIYFENSETQHESTSPLRQKTE